MKKILGTLLAVLLLAHAPAIVHAQGSLHDWSRVQSLGADERVVIKQKDGKTISGRMIEANQTNLTISRNGKVVNIPRDNVAQLEHSRGKAQKTKWAGIGAGIGTAAGAGIGGAKASSVGDDGGI